MSFRILKAAALAASMFIGFTALPAAAQSAPQAGEVPAFKASSPAPVPTKLRPAASGASAVAGKTEGAVKKGMKKGVHAVERGAEAASGAIVRTAKKLHLPTGPASSTPREN